MLTILDSPLWYLVSFKDVAWSPLSLHGLKTGCCVCAGYLYNVDKP